MTSESENIEEEVVTELEKELEKLKGGNTSGT